MGAPIVDSTTRVTDPERDGRDSGCDAVVRWDTLGTRPLQAHQQCRPSDPRLLRLHHALTGEKQEQEKEVGVGLVWHWQRILAFRRLRGDSAW